MGHRRGKQELQNKDRRALVSGSQLPVRTGRGKGDCGRQRVAQEQEQIGLVNCSPCFIAGRAGNEQAVAALEIAYRRRGFRTEDAVDVYKRQAI